MLKFNLEGDFIYKTEKLGDLFHFEKRSKIKAGEGLVSGKYKFFTSSPFQSKFFDDYTFDKESLIFGTGGIPSIHYCNERFSTSTDCFVVTSKQNNVLTKYVFYYLLNNMNILERGFKGAGLKHISKKYLQNIEITFPTNLSVQEEIINKLTSIYDLLPLKNQSIRLLDAYLDNVFIKLFGNPILNSLNWKTMKFDEVGSLNRGKSKHRPRNDSILLGGKYPLIQTGDVANAGNYIYDYNQTYSELGLRQSKMWPKNTLCITIAANIAKTTILTFESCFPDSIVGFIPNENVVVEYVQYWLKFLQKILEEQAPQSAQKNINLKILANLEIPIPPIELQKQFADLVRQMEIIKKQQINSRREIENLIESMMKKTFQEE